MWFLGGEGKARGDKKRCLVASQLTLKRRDFRVEEKKSRNFRVFWEEGEKVDFFEFFESYIRVIIRWWPPFDRGHPQKGGNAKNGIICPRGEK